VDAEARLKSGIQSGFRKNSVSNLTEVLMNNLNTTLVLALICFVFASIATGFAAVSSIGEINVEGSNQGKVVASSTAALIVSLIIDRSRAEPGEEIKTIEIMMPSGFSEPSDEKVFLDSKETDFTPKVSGQSLLIELKDWILDFKSTPADIFFKVRTPNLVTKRAAFRVRLRNPFDDVIGDYVRPGNADQKEENNDSFNLIVVANEPPPTPTEFVAKADPNGENDVLISWDKSPDSDVDGYFVYRDGIQIDIPTAEATEFRDINVPKGEYGYTIKAHKAGGQLLSKSSEIVTVNVDIDRKPPAPPPSLEVKLTDYGMELKWTSSSTADVVKYIVSLKKPQDKEPQKLTELLKEKGKPDEKGGGLLYSFTDKPDLSKPGEYIYTVAAVDEANNKSEEIFGAHRVVDKPYPNPFTPLSSNEKFNKITFAAGMVGDVEGQFSVKIYDIDGALVKEFVAIAGERDWKWDGKDENGDYVESGIYIYQIQVGDEKPVPGTIIVAK